MQRCIDRHISKELTALQPELIRVICPMTDAGYPLCNNARITGISECLNELGAFA